MLIFLVIGNASAQVCGSAGKDGPVTIPTSPNTYFPGVDGTTLGIGSSSIPVGAANINGDTTPISPGDLLLIIQMQDAVINTSNSATYGSGTGTGAGYTGGSAGYFEYAVATNSVTTAGGTITLASGTIHAYASQAYSATTARRTYQVVRVPQYSTATLSGTVTGAAWDGRSGGIVAIDVAGTLTLSGGTINVSGRGFRGGGGRTLSGGTGANTDYVFNATTHGGSKGEGIAGTPRYTYNGLSVTDNTNEGYLSGSYGRGAPGNAGGGGTDGHPSANDENSGGGGGGNGGAGGRGGNSWNSNLVVGGLGGAAFAQAGATRLVMGGGGGAGTSNNNAEATASGGAGGGIVMLRVGSVSGSGTINANGANAPTSAATCCDDGAGGGGAGGSVMIVANNPAGLSGLSVTARGGRGGDTRKDSAPHGPGGGGGGGVILSNGSTGGLSPVIGGDNGLTGGNIAFNSTPGTSGGIDPFLNPASVPGARQGTVCLPQLAVTKTTTTPTRTAGQRATYIITVTNAATAGWVHGMSISDVLPAPHFTYNTTQSVTLSGSAVRTSTTNPASGDAVPVWSEFRLPPGGSVAINFRANLSGSTPDGIYQNPATATYPDPVRVLSTATASASYNPASSPNEDVAVGAPNVGLVKSCPTPATCLTQPQPPGTELTYQIVFTNTGSEAASSLILLDAIPANTDFKVGSATVATGSTGLTFVREYSSNYNPASPGLATWTYTPVSGAGGAPAGFDRNVKAVRWRVTAGTLSQTSPNNTGNIGFTVRIR